MEEFPMKTLIATVAPATLMSSAAHALRRGHEVAFGMQRLVKRQNINASSSKT
jgi:hypothetical protein